jgi:hypothetical protein
MDFKSYKLLGFERGKGYKKYTAVLEDKKSKKIIHIAFGDKRYEQYKDNVLGLYSHLDHNDIKRKNNYRTRHKQDKLNEYSSGYFSYYYLWN